MNTNNKNLLMTVVFIFGFLLLWDSLVMRRYAPPVGKSSTIATKNTTSNSQLTAQIEPGKDVVNENTPRDVVLQSDQIELKFNTKGAAIQQIKIHERDHWLQLFPSRPEQTDSALASFSDLNFNVVSNENNQITFEAHHPSGFDVRKTIKLLAEPPFHQITFSFINRTAKPVDVDAALNWTGGLTHRGADQPYVEKEEKAIDTEMRAVAFGARVMSYRPGVIFGRVINVMVPGVLTWIGVDNTHFLAALISPDKEISGVTVKDTRSTSPEFHVPFQFSLQPNETLNRSFLLYIGPKEYTELAKLPHNISAAVDFGMFGIISRTLLKGLHALYHATGNYGWSIILLTMCVQLLVFPLTRKSFQHSARMRELQPQLKVLQEQFKNDPKRLQIETLNLYKRNGMKMMGMEGCFPMLLQMPIFFAFYATMRAAYELRGAPWIFWIHDLGAKDPHYLLPILMGIGMFVQQKLTAVAIDPAQAKMMMFMPIMFTFMFLQLPSGLVLYWFTNSLMSILIQRTLAWQMKQAPQILPPPSS